MRSPDRPFDGLAVIVMRSAGPEDGSFGAAVRRCCGTFICRAA
jgi:hypothetical protein